MQRRNRELHLYLFDLTVAIRVGHISEAGHPTPREPRQCVCGSAHVCRQNSGRRIRHCPVYEAYDKVLIDQYVISSPNNSQLLLIYCERILSIYRYGNYLDFLLCELLRCTCVQDMTYIFHIFFL